RLENLKRFALPLIRRFHSLPSNAVWSDWLEAFAGPPRGGLRGPPALVSVFGGFACVGGVGPRGARGGVGGVSGPLGFLWRRPGPRRFGSVFISSIDEARGRRFDVVFLPGLAEGLFPRKVMEDPLLLDGWRPAPLKVQDDRVRQERLLLRRAVAVASERLIF